MNLNTGRKIKSHEKKIYGDKKHAKKVFKTLQKTYPDAHCELNHESPYQLLVATILSAQCTDKRVNQITPALFKAAPDAETMFKLGEIKVMELIKSCGFFRNKSKNIVNMSQIVLKKYDGAIPEDRKSLEELPGVGRKTASVVLSNAFGVPALAVDTHVYRVSRCLGLSSAKTVNKVEVDLMELFPKRDWSELHHSLIFHGRYHCIARRPKCETCPLTKECKYYQLQSYGSNYCSKK